MNNIFNDLNEKIKIEAKAEYDNELSTMRESIVGVRAFREGGEFVVKHIQAEYDKLCPKPEEFGEANCIAIDSHGAIYGYSEYPKPTLSGWHGYLCSWLKSIEIPLGLDWRLCRWSLDDAKRIHGEK